MLEQALALAALGFKIIPVRRADKKPAIEAWQRSGTSDPEEIKSWYKRWPDGNYGILTGAVALIVVVDVDGPEGELSLAEMIRRVGLLPDTREHKTARGRHLFYLIPAGVTIKRKIKLASKLDIMGDGSQVLGPGSVHPTGVVYEVLCDRPLAQLPAAWVAHLTRPRLAAGGPAAPAQPGQQLLDHGLTAYQSATLRNALDRMRAAVPNENRNDTLNREAYACAQYGVPRHLVEAELVPLAIEVGLGESEARTTFESGWRAGIAHPKEPPIRAIIPRRVSSVPSRPFDVALPTPASKESAPATIEPMPNWRDGINYSKEGKIKNTLGNLGILLDNDKPLLGLFAYDAFREQIILTRQPPWNGMPGPRALSDVDIHELRSWVERRESVAFKAGETFDAVQMIAERHRFDDLMTYLTALRWDGVDRLESWLSDYLGCENTAWSRAVGKRWMLQATKRALFPGCKADYVLVLEGPQGIGKSETLRALAGDEWFSDTLTGMESRDDWMQLSGAWIFELSELGATKKTDVERVKAFVSRRVERYRPPFGRAMKQVPRRCAFAASSNERWWARDPTGGRRFWPVLCTFANPAAIAKVRDQLWAEAIERVRRGESSWLDSPELERQAEEEMEQRFNADPWEETLADRLNGRDRITQDEVFGKLGIEVAKRGQAEMNRVGAILRRLGFDNSGRAGTGRAWVRNAQ